MEMNDLISKSELIRLLNDKYIGLNDATDLYYGGKFDCFKEIKLIIKNQQIAYDVDKIIKELENMSNDIPLQYENNYEQGISDGIDEAIEIVKQGVTTDDMCEWILCDEEANVYDTNCRNPHILIEGTPKENNYEYCPYCGKKIKVVE